MIIILTYFFRDFLGSFAHAVEDNISDIVVDVIKLLEQVRQAVFVVVVDHSVDIVNLSDIGVVHLEVLGEAVGVLLVNMVGPTLPVFNMALTNKNN